MLRKFIFYIVIVLAFTGCYSLNPDELSEEITWPPEISVPLGYQWIAYEDVYDIPGYPIFPGEPGRPVSYIQKEFLDFDMTDALAKREYIESLAIKLETINRFPADVEVKVYYDRNGTGYESLLGDKSIKLAKADVDPDDGHVIKEKRQVTDLIELDEDVLDDLESVNELIIYATISELIINDVFKANIEDYSIKSSVGARAQLIIKTKP